MSDTTEQPMAPMTEPCPECRFDPDDFPGDGAAGLAPVAAEIEALGRKFAAPLTRFLPGEDGAALLATRPDPDTWSPLEYACHVRDVLVRFRERTAAMLATPGVAFGWWDHEAAAVDERYNDAAPAEVATQIAEATRAYAAALRDVDDVGAAASGERRPGEIFTVHTLAVWGLHEAKHHQLDIGRGLRTARGR